MEERLGMPATPIEPLETPTTIGTSADFLGMSRGPYIVIFFLAAAFCASAEISTTGAGRDASLNYLPILINSLLSAVIMTVSSYYRLKNIGLTPWLCLLALFPGGGFFVGYWCFVFPPGYAMSKKLDRWGIGIMSGIVAPVVLTTISVIYALLSNGRD